MTKNSKPLVLLLTQIWKNIQKILLSNFENVFIAPKHPDNVHKSDPPAPGEHLFLACPWSLCLVISAPFCKHGHQNRAKIIEQKEKPFFYVSFLYL